MTTKEMHYDFKQKLNRVDSQKNRDLLVPEIDWKLNEAQEVFVKIVAQPKLANRLGFEVNQRSIDDIRTIVVNQARDGGIVLSKLDDTSYIGELPDDYWFYANSVVYADKGSCKDKRLPFVKIVQHDDQAEDSPFDRSSFEWGVSNIRFIKDGIRVFTDGTYSPKSMVMDYLLKPRRIHNAQDYDDGQYNALDGTTLKGMINCELPEKVHRDVVDLAVLITANDLNLFTYGYKKDKVALK